ncbi:MAG: ThiF family adenylyltransferase, partial [Myxococcota bacterium]
MVDGDHDRVGQAGADSVRISQTAVLVVVDEVDLGDPWFHPARLVCGALGALGFGGIHLRGAGAFGEDFSQTMEGFPFTHDDLRPETTPPCHMVLHLGTNSATRDDCARIAQSRSSAFASVFWGKNWVAMASLAEILRGDRGLHPNLRVGEEPIEPIARVAAGLALQEVLISAGRLKDAAPPAPRICFDAAAETRTHQGDASPPPPWPDAFIEDAILETIGAGAVGTHFLESFAPLLGPGCELRIIDFDRVGPENLATQPVFTQEDVGRPKAVAMAEKLAPLCDPELRIRPLVMRYEDRPPGLLPPSLRIACPDNFSARLFVNCCSLADGIPLVEAGSAPLVAQHRSYLPGHTSCLQHRIPNLAERAARERDRARCSQNRAITLPGTSMVSGGILAT